MSLRSPRVSSFHARRAKQCPPRRAAGGPALAPLPSLWRSLSSRGELAGAACERNGADQGVHNFVLFGGALRDALAAARAGAITVVSNEDGWVGTVQSMHALPRDRAGRLLNARGQPYALVHQYDRSKVLLDQLEREFTWMEPGTVAK